MWRERKNGGDECFHCTHGAGENKLINNQAKQRADTMGKLKPRSRKKRGGALTNVEPEHTRDLSKLKKGVENYRLNPKVPVYEQAEKGGGGRQPT